MAGLPEPQCQNGPLGHGIAAMPARGWNDPFMVIDAIAIHVSNTAVRQSGLFGLLGDEHIQLVDLYDENRLDEYWIFVWAVIEAAEKQASSVIGWYLQVIEEPSFWRSFIGVKWPGRGRFGVSGRR